mmetsp:Transcript_15676/g.28158  ORF Transcript_15676/g.28158 Transcript_15676/m.28158 type:complete len:209 (-) Transcript_15676:3366-3992(-)
MASSSPRRMCWATSSRRNSRRCPSSRPRPRSSFRSSAVWWTWVARGSSRPASSSCSPPSSDSSLRQSPIVNAIRCLWVCSRRSPRASKRTNTCVSHRARKSWWGYSPIPSSCDCRRQHASNRSARSPRRLSLRVPCASHPSRGWLCAASCTTSPRWTRQTTAPCSLSCSSTLRRRLTSHRRSTCCAALRRTSSRSRVRASTTTPTVAT